jgi:putative ABC transport system permease protein
MRLMAGDPFATNSLEQFERDRYRGIILQGMVIASCAVLALIIAAMGLFALTTFMTEQRTREIGVRKAIGARRRDIIGQFLVEAMTLTGAGGILGILIAVLITLLLGALVPSLPSSVPAWALITGFTVSVAVGVFFGVWPAVKAARLDPVEALRYE